MIIVIIYHKLTLMTIAYT